MNCPKCESRELKNKKANQAIYLLSMFFCLALCLIGYAYNSYLMILSFATENPALNDAGFMITEGGLMAGILIFTLFLFQDS